MSFRIKPAGLALGGTVNGNLVITGSVISGVDGVTAGQFEVKSTTAGVRGMLRAVAGSVQVGGISNHGLSLMHNNTVVAFTDATAIVHAPNIDLSWQSDGNGDIGFTKTANRPGNAFVKVNVEAGALVVASETEGRTGRLTRQTAREVVAMGTGATAVSAALAIPAGARLLGASFNVDVAVTNDGDDTWLAAFSGGSTTNIAAAGRAATQDTKVDTNIVPEIATATTEVTFTPQAANFTAGSIEVVVYYEVLTSLANVV